MSKEQRLFTSASFAGGRASRPEHVVKAVALREAADDWESTAIKGGPIGGWLRERADALDPPAQPEPTGDRAVVRDRGGDVWTRVEAPPTLALWHRSIDTAYNTWRDLVDMYGPLMVLSNGVGEDS